MGLFLTACGALVLWIVLWAVWVKPFDAFLLGLLFVVIAATVRIVSPYLPGNRPDQDELG
jgi:hypothetical protein